ncbi:hypothetical protein [Streptomyces sp. NPDC048172]|uniref:hypothetical protein n=1 Tax=Streptomyces sp. NPDC048172 TaxID=3365505 RepID=UPI0037220D7A
MRKSSMPPRLAAAVACVAVLGLFGTACSDSSGEKGGKDGKDSAAQGGGKTEADQAVEWRKCLRDNGVKMPEPKGDDAQAGVQVDRSNQGAMKKAIEACKDKAPKNGPGSPMSQKERDALVERTKCLRKHGVDVPVPKEGQAAALPRPKNAAEKKELAKAHKACGSETR